MIDLWHPSSLQHVQSTTNKHIKYFLSVCIIKRHSILQISNNIDDITKHFEELDIQHQNEWKKLLYKQQQDKKDLLKQFKQKTNKSLKTKSSRIVQNILSHNNHPLQQGDTVILRTTPSVGYKGDTATVTYVSKN